MDNQENHEQEPDTETPPGEIQDIYVLIVREREEEEDAPFIVETTPLPSQKISFLPAYTFCGLYLLCILATLAFQLYCIGNPEIALVTILPKSQVVTLSGTVQLGHLQSPITISQSQTVATTGHGYQPAEQARGIITFYNGQFQPVALAAGTILTGANGIQVITSQDATIPAGNPPRYGQATVAAHSIQSGSSGNIAAFDINEPCCFASVLAKNTYPFTGGQDERTYPTVTQNDIHSISTVLKTALSQSVTGALQGQVNPPEQLFILPCTPTVTSDHRIGDDATRVKVTVSQTCSAVAYNREELAAKATAMLAARAKQTSGTGYSLFGTVHVSVKQASVTGTPHPLVFLLFEAKGTWVYALDRPEQLHIQRLIAGMSTPKAMLLVESLPGVAHAAIHFTGIGDPERVPKNTQDIHLVLVVM